MEPHFPKAPRRGQATRVLTALAALGLTLGSLATGVMLVRAAPATDVLDAQRARVRALEAEVLQIDGQATAAADAHAAAVERARDLRARIADTTRLIGETERARESAVERLSERLVAIYADRPPTFAEVLLSSGSITAALDTQEALDAVSRQDARVVDALRASRARLTRLRAELVSGQDEVEAQVAASQARLAELEGLIGDRRAALAGARGRLDSIVQARARAADRATERALLRRAQPSPAPSSAPAEGPATLATPAPAPASAATPAPAPSGPAPSGDVAAALERIAACESGGNPRAVSPSGRYRGKYQFDQGTWEALGGTGDPAAAPEAEQDRIAALLYARSGPAPWPVCGYR